MDRDSEITPTWDGITQAKTLKDEHVVLRNDLADAARNYNWPRVFEIIREYREMVNASRPGGSSWFTPLHQAAYGGAPVEIVRQLINVGAWRTLRNKSGERPIDLAIKMKHVHLEKILEPDYRHWVPLDDLQKIQAQFHAVIRGRADKFIQEHKLRLPELEPLLELDRPEMWFPIPGMYGGFKYHLEVTGEKTRLVSESWCRVVGGSGQRHAITAEDSVLEEEGFV
jgi:hypothetical protein